MNINCQERRASVAYELSTYSLAGTPLPFPQRLLFLCTWDMGWGWGSYSPFEIGTFCRRVVSKVWLLPLLLPSCISAEMHFQGMRLFPRGPAVVGTHVDSLLLRHKQGTEPCQQPPLPLGWKMGLFSPEESFFIELLFLAFIFN